MELNKSLLVLPSKEISKNKPYYLSNLDNHALGLKIFSDDYDLKISCEILGDLPNEYFGPHWADAITRLGNVVILFDFMIIIYVPKTLSEEQFNWLQLWKSFFINQSEKVRGIIYKENTEDYIFIEENNQSVIEIMYDEIEKKSSNSRK